MFFNRPVPTTTSNVEMAARMRQVRCQHEYSTSKVAAMVNVSDNHYYQVENGKRAMSLDLAIVFCERFDIRADWLLFGKGEVRNGDEKADLGGRRFKLTPALQELHEIADKIKEEEQRESETNS